MYALMYIGAAAAMLNTSLSVPELLTMLGQTRPRLLLLGHSEREQDGFAPRFAGVDMPSSIEHTVLLERGAGALPLLTDLPCAPETELDTAYNGRTILPRRRMTASALPCRCIIAFCVSGNLFAALAVGACVCLPRDRHTANVIDTVQKARCTVLNSVPTMFRAMLAKEDFFTRARGFTAHRHHCRSWLLPGGV